MKIEFFRHNIGDREIKEVSDVLNSLFLTTGDKVAEFERSFANYLQCKYTIGLNSGTAALHLALLAYDIGNGDEVITTPMSFVASANAIVMAGAKPVFVDVEEETGNINAELIEKAITERTKAILPVHLYGQMCDMKKIRKIADKYGLIVIEDAAHAIEAERDGVKVGQLGDLACFSFYATKNITSGEGGAISTNNEEINKKLKMLRLHGLDSDAFDRYTDKYRHYDMPILGWKYNMDNIHAALLINQLKNIENYLSRRKEIWIKYENAFENIKGINFPKVLPDSKHSRHLFTIWVNPQKRDEILWQLQKSGIGVAVNFRAIHLMEYYRRTFGFRRGMFLNAEKIGDSTITLPLYPKMRDEEVDYVIKRIIQLV